jgi:hypothetical protein
VKKVLFAVLLLCSPLIFSQESRLPEKISVTELPPEPVSAGTCQKSYSGYLEIADHKKDKKINFSSEQIGDYVKKRLAEGYSLSLYPQASGRLFIIETCESKKN